MIKRCNSWAQMWLSDRALAEHMQVTRFNSQHNKQMELLWIWTKGDAVLPHRLSLTEAGRLTWVLRIRRSTDVRFPLSS